jgi:cytochrome P450
MLPFESLPEFEIFDGSFSQQPRARIEAARMLGPMVRSSRGLEILSNSLCQAALRDQEHLGSDHMVTVADVGIPEGRVLEYKRRREMGFHHVVRRVMGKYIGAGPVRAMRPGIGAIIVGLLDAAATSAEGNVDLLNDLCQLLPARLYCDWIGAPAEDAAFVSRVSNQVLMINHHDPKYMPTIVAGYEELFDYVQGHIERVEANPDGTILAKLIADRDAGELTGQELVDLTCMLLEASTDNTASQIAFCLSAIFEHPDVYRRVREDRELIATTIKEAIRYRPRFITLQRYATSDFEFAGVQVPQNTKVNTIVWGSDSDPSIYESPEKFTIDRTGPSRSLTFGYGARSCVGQFLAEVEAQEALAAILDRYADPRVVAFAMEAKPFEATATRFEAQLQ